MIKKVDMFPKNWTKDNFKRYLIEAGGPKMKKIPIYRGGDCV